MRILKLEQLSSINQLNNTINDFKRNGRSFFTNYIPDRTLHEKWVEQGNAFVFTFDNGIYIVFDCEFMLNIIFISRSKEEINDCLTEIGKKYGKPAVLEYILREGKDQSLGLPNKILRRMSRCGTFADSILPSKCVKKAILDDIPALLAIFKQYFDPLTERIPDNDEFIKLISSNGISIMCKNTEIIGMVIYQKNTLSIHLRYWWVSPNYRGNGVGADLLKDFFHSGRGCKRQFLWVFSDNTNAIERYKHYGFSFDGLADEIYIVK